MIKRFERATYYNLREISDKTGYNLNTFRRWMKSGKIIGQKVGKKYYISGDQLNKVFGL